MANTSILAAFERMWQHIVVSLGNKSDINHTHDDIYYTETEIDEKITTTLETSKTYTDNAVSQKSQVQFITWEADD